MCLRQAPPVPSAEIINKLRGYSGMNLEAQARRLVEVNDSRRPCSACSSCLELEFAFWPYWCSHWTRWRSSWFSGDHVSHARRETVDGIRSSRTIR